MRMKSNYPVVLITGGAKRIGAIIAKTLHQNGYNILIHYRKSAEAANSLVAELNTTRPHSANCLQADFNHFNELKDLIQQAYQLWQRLDVLVNNASDFFPTVVSDEISEQSWELLMNSNLKGPYFLSLYASSYLKQQQGCIVNITDIHGQKPLKNYSVYSIAKAGLTMLTKALAKDLAPEIRVNAVAPGPTIWPENTSILSDKQKNKILEKTALKKLVNPQQIATTVLFFCQQTAITGQVLNVDCGRNL